MSSQVPSPTIRQERKWVRQCLLSFMAVLQVSAVPLVAQVSPSLAGLGGTAHASTTPRQEGKDYSGTNNQEEGVDEADLVKTDGYYIYVLHGDRLHVFGVPEFGSLDPLSLLDIEGWPSEMLITGDARATETGGFDRIAVFSTVLADTLPLRHPLRALVSRGASRWRPRSFTKITVFDVGDHSNPRLSREIYIEGSYQAARLVDGSVRLAAFSDLAALGDHRSRIYERLPDGSFAAHDDPSFHRPTDSHGRGITTILTLDLSRDGLPLDAVQIVTDATRLYASSQYLYLAEPAHDWWWFWWEVMDEDVTNLHAFDIRAPGDTTYIGSGRVAGLVRNSFSMGEKDGVLRVVTTVKPSAKAPLSADLSMLRADEGRLIEVGHLAGLDTDTKVGAARIHSDRAYIVTFRNIDAEPTGTFVVADVTDPVTPRVLGSLKVPGVSTYIHPLGDGRLLTIGWGGDEQRPLRQRFRAALFDVSGESHPSLLDIQGFPGGRPSFNWEHKTFQYCGPKKLLALPVSWVAVAGDGSRRSHRRGSTLEVVSVDDDSLALHGTIDHAEFFERPSEGFAQHTEMRRGLFMGEFLYAISDRGITVHRLSDLSLVTGVELPRIGR